MGTCIKYSKSSRVNPCQDISHIESSDWLWRVNRPIQASFTETRSITADTALRLGIFFGVAPETWLNLQTEYDLRVVRRNFGEEIARTVRKRDAA
jgi:plasmid maintenance system antidote protein VapI